VYRKHIKRLFDIICAFLALAVFCWLYIIITVLVKTRIGSPVFFTQGRPGKNEKIFQIIKFRTMTNQRDENGDLLPDGERITGLGRFLRSTSLDELPEAWNILKGDMSVVGPRPQLVRDMVFMSTRHRERHSVRPGLTGLAQINGRNSILWEEKLDYDLEYLRRITFLGDCKLILKTVKGALLRKEGVSQEGMATAEDYGDYLLRTGKISKTEYAEKIRKSERLL